MSRVVIQCVESSCTVGSCIVSSCTAGSSESSCIAGRCAAAAAESNHSTQSNPIPCYCMVQEKLPTHSEWEVGDDSLKTVSGATVGNSMRC